MERSRKLDGKCKQILITLSLHGKDMRFNELYEAVKDNVKKDGQTISKPTFNEHIQDLTKRKLVFRNEKSKQNIAYSLNYDKFQRLQGFDLLRKYIDEYLNGRKGLELVNDLIQFAGLRYTYLLRTKIQSLVLETKPELALESLLVDDLIFKHSEDFVIEKCRKDRKFCEEMLDDLDSISKGFVSKLEILAGHEDIQDKIKSLIMGK
ncbi:MAG TPA: hypothetical protein VK487_00995 [Candidatus Bathyarchaeia archaeon]|nr:hypothetical protein [Candidatus Bathyarchaeia archaeon]